MKKYILLFFLLFSFTFLLSSCSPQKRLEKLLKKYPELLTTDTLLLSALVPIPAKASQFEINMNIKDSLVEIQGDDNIILSYYISNDSIIEVLVNLPPDTILVPVQVPVEKIKYVKEDYFNQLIKTIPYLCLAFIALVFSAFFLFKKK